MTFKRRNYTGIGSISSDQRIMDEFASILLDNEIKDMLFPVRFYGNPGETVVKVEPMAEGSYHISIKYSNSGYSDVRKTVEAIQNQILSAINDYILSHAEAEAEKIYSLYVDIKGKNPFVVGQNGIFYGYFGYSSPCVSGNYVIFCNEKGKTFYTYAGALSLKYILVAQEVCKLHTVQPKLLTASGIELVANLTLDKHDVKVEYFHNVRPHLTPKNKGGLQLDATSYNALKKAIDKKGFVLSQPDLLSEDSLIADSDEISLSGLIDIAYLPEEIAEDTEVKLTVDVCVDLIEDAKLKGDKLSIYLKKGINPADANVRILDALGAIIWVVEVYIDDVFVNDGLYDIGANPVMC